MNFTSSKTFVVASRHSSKLLLEFVAATTFKLKLTLTFLNIAFSSHSSCLLSELSQEEGKKQSSCWSGEEVNPRQSSKELTPQHSSLHERKENQIPKYSMHLLANDENTSSLVLEIIPE